MKLKFSVAIALFVSFLLIGSIIILAFVKSFFIPTYFFFVILMLIALIFLIRDQFESKPDLIFGLICIIFVAVSLVYFVNSVKIYSETNQEFMNNHQDLIFQIDNLTQNNAYYTNYLNNIQKQIETLQTNSIQLQAQIDSISGSANNVQTTQPVQGNQASQPIYNGDDDGNEGGEND
jgi:hypothetical protein